MENNPKDLLKQTTIIYLSLISGQLLVCMVIVFLNMGNETVTGSIFNYIAPVISLGTISAAFFFKGIHQNKAKQLTDETEKLEHFRASNIMRWALVEGGTLTMVIFFFLENNYLYLGLFALGMVAFSMLRPTVESLREDYGLKI